MKKPSLDYPADTLVLLQSLQDFTYLAFKGFLCGIFVHLATQHIPSQSFETLHTSPNHSFLKIKLSLSKWWGTRERFKSRGAPELSSGRLVPAGSSIFEGSGSGRNR